MEITMAVIVALIMAINQGIKQAIPAKFIPLVSVGLGLVAGLFVLPYEGGIQTGIINGLAMGLSACGLFDLGKKAATIVSGEKTE
jgi:hypothetical protein